MHGPSGPLKLTIDASWPQGPGLVEELKAVFEHHKGEAEFGS